MKGDQVSFDVSEDGRRLENLTFIGYCRCDGKLESMTAGPKRSFEIRNGRVNDHISEPPNGGSTAWRFELDATIEAKGIWNFSHEHQQPWLRYLQTKMGS
ncbi:MAG: hypothetical protein C4308_00750 [Chitinophagaceae bacterium]